MKKPLKIAIVSDAIYPYNIGGKEKRIFELTTRLAKKRLLEGGRVKRSETSDSFKVDQKFNITIYCMRWPGMKNDKQLLENGILIKPISKYYPLYSGPRRSIKQAILFSLSCFKLLLENFDIIDADHMPHLVLFPLKIVSLLKRKKFYATWNEVWGREYWKKYIGPLGEIAYIIEWTSARLPDEIISISSHTTEKLQKELKIKQPTHTIPNGINFLEIQKAKPSSTKSDIIFAGRLLAHKNVDFLIKTIHQLKKSFPKIKCLIIGKGPEKEKLINLVKKLKLQKNITFYEFLENHSNLYALMKSSKIFAFPTTREGFGIAALEANACGIPFITTDHPDNATTKLITQIKNGYALELNLNSWTNKITQLFNDINTNKKTFQDFSKKFDWNKLAKEIEEIYLA